MVNSPSKDINIVPLDSKNKLILQNIRDYLEVNGDCFYENFYNPLKKDYNYYIQGSVVAISEFPEKASILILASGEQSLTDIETTLEDMLGEDTSGEDILEGD
jgi:hypothetical protein